MQGGRCNLPAAKAYAVNVTVVPQEPLRWLTVWPSGVVMPFVSLLNSYDGRIKASSSIVVTGDDGAINIFASDTTHVIVDVTGYFVETSQSKFHPLVPCRVVDTRISDLGYPFVPALTERQFPMQSTACGVPADADGYAVNFTAIPKRGSMTWMTAWPSGTDRPLASIINVPMPGPTANSAIIQGGSGSNISVYGSDDFDLVVDVNGYFSSSEPGGYSFYPTNPCRLVDTRQSQTQAPVDGTMSVTAAGACGISTAASVIAGVVTAVPNGRLGWLTLWPQGDKPTASNLNAYDGTVTSNFTLTPLAGGSFSAFVTDPSHLIYDVAGYFAP